MVLPCVVLPCVVLARGAGAWCWRMVLASCARWRPRGVGLARFGPRSHRGAGGGGDGDGQQHVEEQPAGGEGAAVDGADALDGRRDGRGCVEQQPAQPTSTQGRQCGPGGVCAA